jgi:hypothetical protein
MPGTYQLAQDWPGLGRHVNHDPRSARFPYVRGTGSAYRPPAVFHPRHVPIFDQGQLGSCTANAGLGLMATGPFWDALCAVTQTPNPSGAGPYPFTEDGAVALYENITANDPFDGQYPPDDTGSDGLSMAQALQRAGIIPGYQHTFTLADALKALADYPLAVGTVWTEQMFSPNGSGLIHYTGAAVGGHEWIVDQYVPEHDWIGGTTSWGATFGVNGRFYLTVADFGKLLANDGDVTVLTPPTAPAPTPVPDPTPTPAPARPDDADRALDTAYATWRQARGL